MGNNLALATPRKRFSGSSTVIQSKATPIKKHGRSDLQRRDIGRETARDHPRALAQRVIFGTRTRWGTARLPGSLGVHHQQERRHQDEAEPRRSPGHLPRICHASRAGASEHAVQVKQALHSPCRCCCRCRCRFLEAERRRLAARFLFISCAPGIQRKPGATPPSPL